MSINPQTTTQTTNLHQEWQTCDDPVDRTHEITERLSKPEFGLVRDLYLDGDKTEFSYIG